LDDIITSLMEKKKQATEAKKEMDRVEE